MKNEAELGHVSGVSIRFCDGFTELVAGTLCLLASSMRCEGSDPWIESTYAALDDGLRADLRLTFLSLGAPLIFQGLLRESPEISDYPALIGWLTGLSHEMVEQAARDALSRLERRAVESGEKPLDPPDPGNADALAAYLGVRGRFWMDGRALTDPEKEHLVRLLGDPVELKSRLVFSVARFWEAHFKDVYSEISRKTERFAGRDRMLSRDRDFSQFYRAVTGHALSSDEVEKHPRLRHALFVPSCFGGPMVHYVPLDATQDAIALIYNCWHDRDGDPESGPALRQMFPLLRALADETRLEILSLLDGRELYAQEIVERLGISQPAVSRHLNLLVASGVLFERRDGGRRFYTVNTQALGTLSRNLTAFRPAGEAQEM